MSGQNFEIDYDWMEQKFWLKNHPDKTDVPEPCKRHPVLKQVETRKLDLQYFFRFKACKQCGHITDFRWIDVRDLYDLNLIEKHTWGRAQLPWRKFAPSEQELKKRLQWFKGEINNAV